MLSPPELQQFVELISVAFIELLGNSAKHISMPCHRVPVAPQHDLHGLGRRHRRQALRRSTLARWLVRLFRRCGTGLRDRQVAQHCNNLLTGGSDAHLFVDPPADQLQQLFIGRLQHSFPDFRHLRSKPISFRAMSTLPPFFPPTEYSNSACSPLEVSHPKAWRMGAIIWNLADSSF